MLPIRQPVMSPPPSDPGIRHWLRRICLSTCCPKRRDKHWMPPRRDHDCLRSNTFKGSRKAACSPKLPQKHSLQHLSDACSPLKKTQVLISSKGCKSKRRRPMRHSGRSDNGKNTTRRPSLPSSSTSKAYRRRLDRGTPEFFEISAL